MSNTETETPAKAKTVLFVGEYFTLTTTVTIDETLRRENENDEDFITRTPSEFLAEYYDFKNLESKSTISIEIIED